MIPEIAIILNQILVLLTLKTSLVTFKLICFSRISLWRDWQKNIAENGEFGKKDIKGGEFGHIGFSIECQYSLATEGCVEVFCTLRLRFIVFEKILQSNMKLFVFVVQDPFIKMKIEHISWPIIWNVMSKSKSTKVY